VDSLIVSKAIIAKADSLGVYQDMETFTGAEGDLKDEELNPNEAYKIPSLR
jgi:hypothetical protein